MSALLLSIVASEPGSGMSNELLLTCVFGLLGVAGVLVGLLWRGQGSKLEDQKRETRSLEERLRKLETEGGEPVRMLRSEIQKLDEKLSDLTQGIKDLTAELAKQREQHLVNQFCQPRTNPGGG